MKRSWWLAVLIWLGVVVVASATAWAVIDTAGRQVLSGPAPDPLVPAAAATASVSHAPSAVLSPRQSPPTTAGTAGSPGPEGSEQRSPELPGTSSRSSSSPDGEASEDASFTEGTWRGAAGTVIARCDGGAVRLHSATPTDSYQVEVGSAGPEELEVKFSGGDGEVRVDARCVGGAPRFDVESESAED